MSQFYTPKTNIKTILLAVCLPIVVVLISGCSDKNNVDLAIVNANVLSVDKNYQNATALLVRQGRIVAVGSDQDILGETTSDTQVIDAQGKTLLPGFNDAHMHPMLVQPSADYVGLPLKDKQALVALLKAQALETPIGSWVIGYGYDDKALGGHLDRRDLDQVSTEHPVVIWHSSFHLMAVNSYALEISNIDRNTPDPEGGFYYRDDNGEPTGLLGERSALEMLKDVNGRPPLPSDLESAAVQLKDVINTLHSHGITSFTDGLVTPELLFLYLQSSPEDLKVRVNLMLDGADLSYARWVKRLSNVIGFFGFEPLNNNWLRVNTIKAFHGMSLSGRTARLYEPYLDRPDYYGEEPQRTQDELDVYVQEIHDIGMQAAIHSNGDYEIDMVLNAIELAQGDVNVANSPRHRIEHGTVVNEKILQRMSDLKIVLAPHSYTNEKGHLLAAYGEQRWDRMSPNASTFEYGIPNAGNSDFPVSKVNPMLRIQSMVTRATPDGKVYGASQRITVEQAIHAYTLGGAYASFEETDKGSITPGKYADFILLSADPRTVAADQLHEIKVEKTFVGGVEVYSR